jgi:replicative DNA helicase
LRGSAALGPAVPSGRVLPHDLDAEQAVLGCLLIDADAILAVRDFLDPGDFYAERHGHIFRAALALSDRGEPVDILTLKVQLERDGSLARSGGIEYLAELSQKMPTAASVPHYAQIVVDHSMRRRLIAAAGEMAQLGFDAGQRTDDILDTAERRIFSIADSRRSLEISHIAQMLTETWELMESRAQSRQIVHGVPTNYSRLDAVTQGLQPGELIILAARPSVGKTSFALNIARNAAVLAERRVVIFSLEMSKQALVQRLICSEAKVDAYLISTGQADAHAFERIAGAMDRLSQANIWIDDTPALPISELRARARRMRAQQKVDLVVVDYLQLMRGGRQDSRVQEVSEISSGLKTIAKELHVPVLALSQLSRESERRENRKPQLSDLRDSGCLTGESLVWLAGECRPVPIRDLVGRRDFEVLALNPETWRLEPRRAVRAFHSGVKPVFRLQLRSGRTIRASANHQFLTVAGWKRLDELVPGTHLAAAAMGGLELSHRDVQARLGTRCREEGFFSHGLSGEQTQSMAIAVKSDELLRLSESDVHWDAVSAVVADGSEEVFDITVEGVHNFMAEDIVVHNSIEQDADVVLFLYRPGMHKDDIDKSVTELLVEKNRNGPTTKIDLHFQANQMVFYEPARE